jgi:hypothetical protein
LTKTPVEKMDKSTVDSHGNPMRTMAYVFLILFLIAATIILIGGAYLGISAIRGVKSVTNPVGDLVRQLAVEATPVILPNPVVIVEEINSLARLETASYSFQDILQIKRNQDMFWGIFGESLLFVAYGDVIAGVDLAQMTADDIQVVSPTKVVVHLPQPEIFLTDLDNDRSYVADRDIGLLTQGDTQLETLIRQEAEDRMVEAALDNDILGMAQQEAESFMITFLEQLGFTEIEFTDSPPPPVTPYVQEVPKGFVLTPHPSIESTPVP